MIINNDARFSSVPMFYPTIPLKGNKVVAVTGMADGWTEQSPEWQDMRDGRVNQQVPASNATSTGGGLQIKIPYNRTVASLPSMVLLYITAIGGYYGMNYPMEFIIKPHTTQGGFQCWWSSWGWYPGTNTNLYGNYYWSYWQWDYEEDCNKSYKTSGSQSFLSGSNTSVKHIDGGLATSTNYKFTLAMHQFFGSSNNSGTNTAGIKNMYYDRSNIYFTLYVTNSLYCNFTYRGFVFE